MLPLASPTRGLLWSTLSVIVFHPICTVTIDFNWLNFCSHCALTSIQTWNVDELLMKCIKIQYIMMIETQKQGKHATATLIFNIKRARGHWPLWVFLGQTIKARMRSHNISNYKITTEAGSETNKQRHLLVRQRVAWWQCTLRVKNKIAKNITIKSNHSIRCDKQSKYWSDAQRESRGGEPAIPLSLRPQNRSKSKKQKNQ